MKKLLLTTALVGVAFVATPAMAEVELGLGGHMKGYVTYVSQDEQPDNVAVAGDQSREARAFDIVRETEIHFTGETTLDNGLTVGFHAEAEADGGNGFEVEESYAYFAGNWGRVNFGAEDGAAYLLQVAAPSADSNIDGIRQYVSSENYAVAPDATFAAAGTFNFTTIPALLGAALDYDQAQTGFADKLTYVTPVFNGFQAAASYTPDTSGYAGSFGVDEDGNIANTSAYGDAYEAAVRYEGQFNAVRVALGGGWTHVNLEEKEPSVPTAATNASDDRDAFNVGGNLGFGPFNVGAVYTQDDRGDIASGAGVTYSQDSDNRVWVIGADYTTGPWVLGASYYDGELEQGAGADLETNRYSGGVTYTYGPGMTFRGSVHHLEHEVGTADFDSTSVLLGTQINF